MNRKGANIIAYPGLIIFAIGMLMLRQAHHGIILLLAGAFFGLGYGNFNSIAQTLSIKNIPRERMGLATATFFIFLNLRLGFGTWI